MSGRNEDIRIIRDLAKRCMEIALSDRYVRMRKRLRDTNDLKIVRPPVIIEEIPWEQMNYEGALDCVCEDAGLRGIEYSLRVALFRDRYFKCDNFLEPHWTVYKSFTKEQNDPPVREKIIRAKHTSIVSHDYEDIFTDESVIEQFRDPVITAHPEQDVQNVAAMQEIEGWNFQESSALDRSTAMLARLRACVPDLPFVLLHAINDGTEQWSALRHAPTRTASEALALGNVFCGKRRALQGYLACLADGVSAHEWKELSRTWRLSFVARESVGVRVVWSDRAFDAEFDACVTSRDASSNTLLAELIRHGLFFAGSVRTEEALADKTMPLLVLNPQFFPEDELAALKDRPAEVILFGRGAPASSLLGEYEMLPAGTPPFPGYPEETSCYWKKPLAENLPPKSAFKHIVWTANKAARAPFDAGSSRLRPFGGRLADGRLVACGRNEGDTYLDTELVFSGSFADMAVLRDFPSLPVRTSAKVRVAPWDTAMIAVREYEQAIPGSTTEELLKEGETK